MRLVVGLCALLALAACGPAAQAGYPPGVEQNFVQACERQGAAAALCACTWDGIERDIEPNDFMALERLPGPERASHQLTQRIEDIAAACHASLAPPAGAEEPTPAP